jgi:OOP family OmpA-OmpF porin
MKLKNLLLIPALMGTMAMADDAKYSYELTPVVGYNIIEGNLNLDNSLMYGFEMQFNDMYDSVIKPEISVLMSNGVETDGVANGIDNYGIYRMDANEKTNILRFAIHGVYEYEELDSIIPFAKAGVGYEHMNNPIGVNTDGPYVSAGGGVKVPFTDYLALKLEALYSLKHNDDSAGANMGDSNLALLAGLTYSFGKKEVPAAVVVDGDDDNDGVKNSIDECLVTPPGATVDTRGCTIDGDDDNDGVKNSFDKCPKTPLGRETDENGCCITIDGDDDNDGVANSKDKCPSTHPDVTKVDANGCATEVDLHVQFKFDSFDATEDTHAHLRDFVNFMDDHTNYEAKIIGHTDSSGPKAYNQTLSEKRAQAVKAILVKKGLDADRITTVGKGENEPKVSNATKEGRIQNRRVEAHINKN